MELDLTRPFLRSKGLAAGLTKHHLDGASFHSVFGSVRLAADVPLTPEMMGRCAALVVPRCAASHQTAARIWGGVVPETSTTHVTVPDARSRRSRRGLQSHVDAGATVRRRRGLLLTVPAQTFLDLAVPLSCVDLVVLGDSLVHQRSTTIQELDRALVEHGTRLPRLAPQAAALVRAGAESPMETRTRLVLVLAGLPEPELQHEVGDETRRFRLDLAYPELKIAVEYDGRQHADDPRQWQHDLARREWLDAHGWRVIVVTTTDVYATPWATVLRVAGAMAARGYVKPLPSSAPPAFAAHFPGQPWRRT
ncbi:endonuclease domain-containing protein [Serinicoccus marinus]|uniref:endonuclease domain-containing protein n=1 Tax=Serinicoccus marinus TaxID=247333 RepID=UPI0003B5D359|nr:DUF559 domain-containing protein [Serinicoccus marinus]